MTTATSAMARGRVDNSARRRHKVIKAINHASRGGDLAVAAIARQAGVNRSFLYRHRDLLEQLRIGPRQPNRPYPIPVR